MKTAFASMWVFGGKTLQKQGFRGIDLGGTQNEVCRGKEVWSVKKTAKTGGKRGGIEAALFTPRGLVFFCAFLKPIFENGSKSAKYKAGGAPGRPKFSKLNVTSNTTKIGVSRASICQRGEKWGSKITSPKKKRKMYQNPPLKTDLKYLDSPL